MCAYLISTCLYQGGIFPCVPWTCSLSRDFSMSILQTRCEMYWKVVIVGWSVEYTHETFPQPNFVSCLVEPVDPVIGVWGSPYRNSFFWIFFFAHIFGMMGEYFGKWKIQKILTPYGVSTQTFFQNSWFFSNISYKTDLVVRLSAARSVYEEHYRKLWRHDIRLKEIFWIISFHWPISKTYSNFDRKTSIITDLEKMILIRKKSR